MNALARYNQLISQGTLVGAPTPIAHQQNGSWVCSIQYKTGVYTANCINKKDAIHQACHRLLESVNPPVTPKVSDCRKAFLATGGRITYHISQVEGAVDAKIEFTTEHISRVSEFKGVNYHEIDHYAKTVCKDVLVELQQHQDLGAALAKPLDLSASQVDFKFDEDSPKLKVNTKNGRSKTNSH